MGDGVLRRMTRDPSCHSPQSNAVPAMSGRYKPDPGLPPLREMATGCNQAEGCIDSAGLGHLQTTTDPRGHQEINPRFVSPQLVSRDHLSGHKPPRTAGGRRPEEVSIYDLPRWLSRLAPVRTFGKNFATVCDALCRVAGSLRGALLAQRVEQKDGGPATAAGAALEAAQSVCVGEKPRNEWMEVLCASEGPEYKGHKLTAAALREARRTLAVAVLHGAV